MRRFASPVVSCVLVALVAACASAPPPKFYMLSRTPAPAAPPSTLSVAVGPVTIPAMVDQPQIVVSISPNQVTLDEFNRWAAPLASNISRVVAENLVDLLGTSRVSQFQQSLNVDADFRVAVEVQNFESTLGDAAAFSAVWAVRRTRDGRTETGRTAVREPPSDKSYDALAAAHSRALSQMSRDIAAAVRTLARAAP